MAERGAPRRRHRGFGARGGFKRQHQAEGAAAGATEEDFESPELKSLRQKHGEHVSTVLAVFPDWDDESVLFALSEAGGSVELAISRIAEGESASTHSIPFFFDLWYTLSLAQYAATDIQTCLLVAVSSL